MRLAAASLLFFACANAAPPPTVVTIPTATSASSASPPPPPAPDAGTPAPSAQPHLAKTLDAFTMDNGTDDATRHALDAVLAMAKAGPVDDGSIVDSLWKLFERVELAKTKSERLYRALHDAVLAVRHPSYGDKAIALLAAPVDANDPDSMKNEVMFRQLTAVQVLADMKYAKAAKPLVLVLLSPAKTDLNAVVRTTLLKIPTAAEPELVKALEATDADYVNAERGFKDKAGLAIVADTLALLSRPAGRDAILAALPKADTETTRAVFAQSLVQFPSDPRIEPAFLAAYRRIARDASVELFFGSLSPRAALTQAAARLYDPSLVDWLVQEADAARNPTDALLPLETAMKLVAPEKTRAVEAAYRRARGSLPKDIDDYVRAMLGAMSGVAERCKRNTGCYFGVLDESTASSGTPAQWRAIKAAYMTVVYGGGANATATRTQLVAHLDAVKNAGARLAVAEAIDALSPRGDDATADAIDAVVASDKASRTMNVMDGSDDALAKVALRLRARAAPPAQPAPAPPSRP
jgi:hypothetical protein